jgi:hypothetical protein
MTRDHTVIDELLAVRALDGLDGADEALLARELAAHGDCEECRRLEAEHAEAATMLALALEPRPVGDEVVERILAQRQDVETSAPATTSAAATATPPPDELAARRRARGWQAAFGVAAAVALVLAVVLATRSAGPAIGDTVVTFQAAGAPGELAMAYTPGESGVLVWGTGLPDPGRDSVYELWMIDEGTPIRGACLSPRDGAVAAFVDADPSSSELMAVTVESTVCPDAPTTDPIYTAELV